MSVKHHRADIKKEVGSVGVKLRQEVWAEHTFGSLWHMVDIESHRNVEDHLAQERK